MSSVEDIQARLREFETGKRDISPDDRGTLRDVRGFISRALQGGDPESAPILDRVGKDWALDLLYNRWISLSDELIRLNHRLQDTYHIHNGTRRRGMLKDALREIFDPEVGPAYYRAPARSLDDAIHRALRGALVGWVERQGRLSPLVFMERMKELHLLSDEGEPKLTALGRYFLNLDPRRGTTFLLLCDLALGYLPQPAIEAFLVEGREFRAEEGPPSRGALTLEQAEWLAAIGVADNVVFSYSPSPAGLLALRSAIQEMDGPWSQLVKGLSSHSYGLERGGVAVGESRAQSQRRGAAWFSRALAQSLEPLGLEASRLAQSIEDDALKEPLQRIASGLGGAQGLLKTFLRYSSAGTQLPEIVSPEEVIRGAVAAWRGGKVEIALEVSLEDELPGVLGSRSDLEDAIRQLLTNAGESLAEVKDPKLRVRARSLEGGNRVAIDVSDNGPGVAPELLPRLFEPGVTTRAGHRGLGLALVREVVELDFQGSVSVGQNISGGADFTILLPSIRTTS